MGNRQSQSAFSLLEAVLNERASKSVHIASTRHSFFPRPFLILLKYALYKIMHLAFFGTCESCSVVADTKIDPGASLEFLGPSNTFQKYQQRHSTAGVILKRVSLYACFCFSCSVLANPIGSSRFPQSSPMGHALIFWLSTFLALMSLPPYVDESNLHHFFAILLDDHLLPDGDYVDHLLPVCIFYRCLYGSSCLRSAGNLQNAIQMRINRFTKYQT